MRSLSDALQHALLTLLMCTNLFMQVFEDRSGAIVLSFDRARAVLEGDLPAYMQNMVKNHLLVSQAPYCSWWARAPPFSSSKHALPHWAGRGGAGLRRCCATMPGASRALSWFILHMTPPGG